MRLIDEQKIVLGKIIEQVGRRGAGRFAGQMPAVVLNPVAVAELLDHLQVEHGALLQPLRLDQPVLAVKGLQPLLQLRLDGLHGNLQPVPGGDEMTARKDGIFGQTLKHHAAQRIDNGNGLDGIPKEPDPDRPLLLVDRKNIDHIPPGPEGAPVKGDIVSLIEHVDQTPLHLLRRKIAPRLQEEMHVLIFLRRAEAIDAGDGGDYHHIFAGQQGAGCRMTHLVDGIVDGRILFNIGIGLGDIGLRLVIIVIGDEIFDGIAGEKLPELRKQLGGQGLVRGDDPGRTLHPFTDTSHGKGLARAGNPQKNQAFLSSFHSTDQFFYSLGLVSGGLEWSDKFKVLIGHRD